MLYALWKLWSGAPQAPKTAWGMRTAPGFQIPNSNLADARATAYTLTERGSWKVRPTKVVPTWNLAFCGTFCYRTSQELKNVGRQKALKLSVATRPCDGSGLITSVWSSFFNFLKKKKRIYPPVPLSSNKIFMLIYMCLEEVRRRLSICKESLVQTAIFLVHLLPDSYWRCYGCVSPKIHTFKS